MAKYSKKCDFYDIFVRDRYEKNVFLRYITEYFDVETSFLRICR